MADWVRVADEADLTGALLVDYAGRDLALFRVDGKVFALDDVCSHEFSRLSEGEIWDHRVYCPKHGSGFDLATGAAVGPPATQPVAAYPAKVEDGGIWVYIDEIP